MCVVARELVDGFDKVPRWEDWGKFELEGCFVVVVGLGAVARQLCQGSFIGGRSLVIRASDPAAEA